MDTDTSGRPEVDGDGNEADAIRAAGGRGRFYMEAKPTLGLVLLKGKKMVHRAWLERHEVSHANTHPQTRA